MEARVTIDVRRPIIRDLLDDLKMGKYLLPSFQRQFEWDEDDIKDLIDSIIKNYPIGSIILWKPSAPRRDVDPFSRPLLDLDAATPRETFYVIDGQQRLTSLLLLFNDWKIKRDGEQIGREPISYNPANKKFFKGTRRGIDLSLLVKAFYEYDDRVIRKLRDEVAAEAYKEMERMIKTVLDKYPVPVSVMETEREDEETFRHMAEAFIRVNKFGIRIGNLELMLSFLAGAISGDLKARIRDLYEDLYDDFEVDLQPVIRFVFYNFGLKQTQIVKVEQFKRNIDRIASVEEEERNRVFRDSDRALRLAVELLKHELGIQNARLLPSQMPLVPVARHLYSIGAHSLDALESEDVARIIDWFVLASFTGFYSSHTDTKLDRDLELMRGRGFPIEELLENMRERRAKTKITLEDVRRGLGVNVLRSLGRAYLFLLYILLVKNQADDWNGVLLGHRSLDELARHHIFPKDFLDEHLEVEDQDMKEILINNLANITFIHKIINPEIGATPPGEYLEEYSGVIGNHFIPVERSLWSIDQYEAFLERRIREVHEAGTRFFGNIFA